MNNVQERLPILAGGEMLGDTLGGGTVEWTNALQIPPAGDDRIKPIFRPVSGLPGTPSGGIATLPIIAQLMSIVQQLLSMFGLGQQAMGAGTYYQNATASSTGDPHLAFNGTDAFGNATQNRFDSMSGHANLLDSDSFNGGYNIATTVTAPARNGVTYNQQATISSDYGRTQVSLDKSGSAYVTEDGHSHAIADGQSFNLGNGETVARQADGSVIVTETNAQGGSIVTTLSENGKGVDVRAQANNVDLGGDLLASAPLQSTF